MGIVENGAIGINGLLKYAIDNDSRHLSVVKDYAEDIRFLLLTQLLNNNIGNQEIPFHILETIFEKEKQPDILREKCGEGYYSKTNFNYKTQLKFLRNALTHNHFSIDRHLISVWHVKMPYHATFDIKWLRALTNYVLGGDEYNLKKGMQEWIVIDESDVPEDDNAAFFDAINKKRIFLIQLEAQTSSQNNLKELLGYEGNAEEISFSVLCDILKKEIIASISDLNAKDFNLIERAWNVVNDICSVFNGAIKAQFVVIDPNLSILKMPNFDKLPKSKKIKMLSIMFSTMSKAKWNRQNLDCMFDLLDKIEAGEEFDEFDEICLNLSRELLIKTYASILFNYLKVNDKSATKSTALTGYLDKIDMRYIHARNVYKEIIKKLTFAISESDKYGESSIGTRRLKNMLYIYNRKLREVEIEPIESALFRHIRNAVVHDYVFIDGDEWETENIKFYDAEPVLHIPKYNKKKGIWEEKSFERNVPLFEMNMRYKDFFEFLSLVYELNGIPVNDNNLKR